jgi:hypothetical protein
VEDADALPFSDQEITKILKAGDTVNGNRPCGHVKVTPRIDHNYIRINMDYLLVPGAGVEPARPEGQGILSPPRMPFRHPGTDGASLSQ